MAQGTGTPTINQVIAVLIKEINNEISVNPNLESKRQQEQSKISSELDSKRNYKI